MRMLGGTTTRPMRYSLGVAMVGSPSIQPTPDRSSSTLTLSLSRADLVSRGAALAVAGGAVGVFAEEASADPASDQDLAYVRLLVTAELLQENFYNQAVAASNTSAEVAKYLKRAVMNEQ